MTPPRRYIWYDPPPWQDLAVRSPIMTSNDRYAEYDWLTTSKAALEGIRQDHYAGAHDTTPEPLCDKGRCNR
jgi:hypothetical protein